MRNISSGALAKLAQNLGTEPINIIEVQWTPDGNRLSYADRDIATGIHGVIQQISGLDNVVQVSGGGQSAQIDIVLSDTDGSLKALMDAYDIHKRPVWVYQWFEGLDISDRFLIFKGQINTGIAWKEGDRTLNFSVISQVEDVEAGFSIEEGDFIDPPADMIGKPWPLCFGTTINVPALRISTPREGVLATGIGIADYTLPARIHAVASELCPQELKGYTASYSQGTLAASLGGGSLIIEPVYGPTATCDQQVCTQRATLQAEYNAQLTFQYNYFRVFDGDKFPQGTRLTVEINGAQFTGTFSGEIFNIQTRIHPDIAHPAEAHGVDVIVHPCGGNTGSPAFQKPVDPNNPGPSAAQVYASRLVASEIPSSTFFWADPGARVLLVSDQQTLYIANLLPSTVLRVAAYRQQIVGRILVTVPPEFYTVRVTDYTGYQVTEIVFSRPLSSRGSGWSDDVYVTQTSSVGPDTVDILTYLIQKYTSHAIDSTSFNHVRTLIDNYPMHFPLLERKNILQVLQEIAYQARCALWLADDVFSIKYLPEEPTIDATIAESDVRANSLEVYLSETENLVTKYVAKWKVDHSLSEPNTVIYRHNVAKYGVHEQQFDYYCFNIQALVSKSATFWLIRLANTWRKTRFQTPLSKLNLEVFDCAGITLPDVADGTIKAIVEKANYDSATQSISFECWTPIRSGDQAAYQFAYPADISEQALFPTITERDLGYAGGGLGPNFITRPPPRHPLSITGATGLFQGFSLACNGGLVEGDLGDNPTCHSDFGLKKPSDRGDRKPDPKASSDGSDAHGGFDPPGGSVNSACCEEAKALAQQALDAAQNASAAANNQQDHKNDGTLNNLPSCESQENTPCVYRVRLDYLIPNLIHHNAGDSPFFENSPGATGFVSLSYDGGSECYAFNSFEGAKQFKIAQDDVREQRHATGGWTVGQRQGNGATALNFRPTDDHDPAGCTNPDKQQIVGYSDNRSGTTNP